MLIYLCATPKYTATTIPIAANIAATDSVKIGDGTTSALPSRRRLIIHAYWNAAATSTTTPSTTSVTPTQSESGWGCGGAIWFGGVNSRRNKPKRATTK